MNKLFLCIGCVAIALAAVGCSDDKTNKCTAAMIAAGTPGCFDSNGNSNMMPGPTPGTNENAPIPGGGGGNMLPTPELDGGVPTNHGGDDGGGGGGGTQCSMPYDTFTNTYMIESPCEDSVRTCLAACTDDACVQACQAEVSEECGGCLGYVSFICPSKNGCMNEFAGSNCCYETKCQNTGSMDPMCFTTECAAEDTAEKACNGGATVASVCTDWTSSIYDECFGGTGVSTDGGVNPPTDGGRAPSCDQPYQKFSDAYGIPMPCNATDRACLDACTDDTCREACLANVSDECSYCVGYTQFICPSKNGCMEEFAESNCCYENQCANATTAGCFEQMCSTQDTAEKACNTTAAGVCSDFGSTIYDDCFGAGGGGGGGECSNPPPSIPDGYTFCTSSTKTCLASCADSDFTCVSNCIDSDTAAPIPTNGGGQVDCMYCLAYQEQYCAATGGCGTQYGAYRCCVEDNNCTTQACVTQNCGTESQAFTQCVVNTSGCTDDYSTGDYAVCFP